MVHTKVQCGSRTTRVQACENEVIIEQYCIEDGLVMFIGIIGIMCTPVTAVFTAVSWT